jgi:hypothetical protein
MGLMFVDSSDNCEDTSDTVNRGKSAIREINSILE